jgi:hypothetical protein
MNIETLVIEQQEILPALQPATSTAEQTPEITPLSFESFKLIGGGSSIVEL